MGGDPTCARCAFFFYILSVAMVQNAPLGASHLCLMVVVFAHGLAEKVT